MQRIQWIGRIGLGVGVALLASACGGSDQVATPRKAEPVEELADDEEWEENTVPVIEWVRLEPEAPAAGASVTAQVRVNDPDGDEIELGYAWRLNGRPARTTGNTLHLGPSA